MNVNEFSANIQYKNSFITECTITNNLLDIGDDAVLKTDVKVAVSNLSLSDDETEKLGKVRLTLILFRTTPMPSWNIISY